MKTMILSVALFCGILHLSAQTAELHLGCDCPLVRLDDGYCAASAVFEALALRDDTIHGVGDITPIARDVIRSIPTSFRVIKVIKGKVDKHVIVHSAVEVDDCGYHFLPGTRYLIFADRENGMLVTDRCDPTRPIADLTPGFLDSLEYVRAGNSWHAGTPIPIPCGE